MENKENFRPGFTIIDEYGNWPYTVPGSYKRKPKRMTASQSRRNRHKPTPTSATSTPRP